MSQLTGQQINQSYQGLLKLSDSSTGITSSFQSIEDGLGNDTGIDIKQNAIISPNILNLPRLATNKGGLGIISSQGMTYQTDEYDSLVCFPFYDAGVNTYTGCNYSISAVTSTSDVVQLGFYTSQWNDTNGLIPYELVSTACTLVVNSTGAKTTSFTSDVSFSAYGQGIYFCVIRTTNVGATPTVRFRTNFIQSFFPGFLNNFYPVSGPVSSPNTNGSGLYSTTSCLSLWNGSVSQWETVFSGATLSSYTPATTVMQFPGIVLRSKI
jgi:hypothetical protein